MLRQLWGCSKICREFVWPCLDYGSPAQIKARKEHVNSVVDRISKARWAASGVILEEIRRLAAREDERRKTAETKATIYLAVLAAIVPLSAAFVKDLAAYLEPLYDWQAIVLLTALLLAIAYLLAAGIWTFKTIGVSGYTRVEVERLLRLSGKQDIELALCRDILRSVMKNRAVVNDKVSNLLMAHEFLIRMFITFVFLVVFSAIITVANKFFIQCAPTL